MTQLIGLAYASRVGKDSAADALVRDLGYQKFSFAAPLKELALEANPLALPVAGLQNVSVGHNRLKWLVQCEGWERAKDRYVEVRNFLESLGNGARKVFHEDFWADIALARAAKVDKAVISDVRFLNEYEAIKALGGKVVRIDRPGFNARPFEQELNDLPGEEWDLVITNDGTVIDLEAKIVAWAKTAFKKAAA